MVTAKRSNGNHIKKEENEESCIKKLLRNVIRIGASRQCTTTKETLRFGYVMFDALNLRSKGTPHLVTDYFG